MKTHCVPDSEMQAGFANAHCARGLLVEVHWWHLLGREGEESMEMKRILFPTDFSENSEYAFLYALALARTFASKLYLLHVVYFPPQMPEFDIGRVLDGLVKSAEKNLKKLIQKTAETQVIFHPEVRVGAEYHEITKLAEKEKIDLIVMGTQGRTGLAHAFLGSVAERVVRYAPCPVLTVKPPQGKGVKPKKKR